MVGTLLIVEDLENDVLFLRHAFRKAALQNPVHVVEDGREAIDYLKGAGRYADRERYPLPAMIFLDLKLPHVQGFDVLGWLRQQHSIPPIVVVVWTASNMEEDIARAYRLGANSYVVKPSSMEKLVEIVKDFANWWFKHNQSPTQSRSRELVVQGQ